MKVESVLSKLRRFFVQTWLVYVLAIIFGMSTVVFLAVFKTPEYSAEVDLLIVQQYTINDPFTATKSATAVRDNLADIIHTTSFYNQVRESGRIELSALEALPEEEKREQWEKIVETESSASSPSLKIVGYDESQSQAEAIASGVAQTLVEHGKEYHSSPDTITLRVIDDPIVSNYPTRPNLLRNGIATAMLGAMIGGLILFLRSSSPFSPPERGRYGDSRGDDDYSDVVDVAADHVKTDPEESLPPPEYNVIDVTNFHVHAPVKEDLSHHPSHMKPQVTVMPKKEEQEL